MVTVTQCLPKLKSSSFINAMPPLPEYIANDDRIILHYLQNSSTS